MRKYRKWVVTLGLVAAAPNVGLAGPFDLFQGEPKAQADGMTNQQVAEAVASQLKQADLQGADIEIEYLDGTLTLKGQAANAGERAVISRLASGVAGVKKVNNQMTVADGAQTAAAAQTARPGVTPAKFESPGPQTQRVQQAGHGMASGANGQTPRQPVMPVNYVQDEADAAPVTPPPGAAPPAAYPGAGMPPGAAVPPGAGMPSGAVPPAPPAWAHGGAAATGAVYDQPALPQYSWPSYAAYPNYAALSYPRQYSASAWPYIGPYYPYPQVPLGWREVELQWDDGHWYLDFNDRTDRWWWFMNPKNW